MFWLSFWLAVVLVSSKAAHLGMPARFTVSGLTDYQRSLAIAAHEDIFYAITAGLAGQLLLWLSARWQKTQTIIWLALLLFFTVSALYGVASLYLFEYVGTPLTYSLMILGGSVKHMSSSLVHFATPLRVSAAIAAPLLFIALALVSPRVFGLRAAGWKLRVMQALAGALLILYILLARRAAAGRDWLNRPDRLIFLNPHWVFISSCFSDATTRTAVHMNATFADEDLADFCLVSERPQEAGEPSRLLALLPSDAHRPKNIITIVIESCPIQHMSLYGCKYPTTPRLDAESKNALIFDNFYCHQGLTANSLVSISLSIFPPNTGWPVTSKQPALPGVMLQQLLAPRGYRTAFISSGDNDYLTQDKFLSNRGFDDVWDCIGLERELGCHKIFSWGVEDKCMIDGMLKWIDRDPKHAAPFYILGWTQQTHHPYEMTPDAPEINFLGSDKVPDGYDYNHYLNCLHTADEQIGRLLDELRQRGLADDTLVIITGDHGEAFGTPHDIWGHGSHVYEEAVHIPLMIWNPRLFATGQHIPQVGGLIDLSPTVADLLGLPLAPPQWQGRSLFDPAHPDRAYFFSSNGDYLLAVREGNWKYIYNATLGREILFDLTADPREQTNIASAHNDLCATLRQRLTAWIKHENGHYASLIRSAK